MQPSATKPMNYRQILHRETPERGRVRAELRGLWADPPPFCRPGASPVTDLFHWEVVIDGPAGTPYEGGTFPLDVVLSDGYPFRPPKITFKTEVFHPNIDSEGEMALDILYDKWSCALKIENILHSIVSVLYDPLLDFPVDDDIADLYKNDIKRYEEIATVWTREYSSTPIVSHYPTKEELDHCEMIAAQAALEKSAKEERMRQRNEEARLRRRRKEEEESERRPKEEEESETILQWLWRRLLDFLFRDGPLPCHIPERRRRSRKQE